MTTLSRRSFLRASALLVGVPAVLPRVTEPVKAFVDDYRTNITANLTADTNAAVRILSGVSRLWRTGSTWNDGVVLDDAALRANIRYCERITAARTDAEAARAFVCDRQHQSYSVIAGLGVLAPIYRAGALAVTGITEAPATTPATTVSDFVPAGAPPGSAIGAGSPDSALGTVVTLVNTIRGEFSSGNPSKFAVQYPRPWRLNRDNRVVDTGVTDEFGFPVYDSTVSVVPQLLRQRGTGPAEDGGFPSGHTNALHLAALAYAYTVPERFQELVTCAFDLSHTRIQSGMHSPLDVTGGRTLATALAAAILNDPANATLKAAAREQAGVYLRAATGTTVDTLYPYAQGNDLDVDPYADRVANRRLVTPKLTYVFRRTGPDRPLTVPKGAEVLLETRQPYLSAEQRRAVLRTTALPAGYALLDGPEQWGRLDLFTAADGFGAFETDVDVRLDAAAGGFAAADTWRNDITGRGGLTLRGTGTLGLTGDNRFAGGVRVLGGTLVAGSVTALGHGDLEITGGTLRVTSDVTVRGTATIGAGSRLDLTPAGGRRRFVLTADRLHGRFSTVTVSAPGWRVETTYTRTSMFARLVKA